MGAPPTPFDAIVTSTHERGPLAGVRGLGRAGYRVLAVAPVRLAAGHVSRHAAGHELSPDSVTEPEEFAARVAEIARERGPVVVYPGQEEGIDALLGRLPAGSRLPYPNPAALPALRDKRRLPEAAREAGLHTPREFAAARAGEVDARDVPLPCVVKAARPGTGPEIARVCESRADALAALAAIPPEAEVLVQEPVTGSLSAVSLVTAEDGSVAARFQQRSVRTWPPEAGVSAVAESVAPDEDLVEACTRLLRAVGYAGLAQLQFVGGTLVDVNPRFYGSLPLALRAGVNLPAVWHRTLLGESTRPEPYRTGVAFRWLEADLLAALRGRPGLLAARPRVRSVAGAWWSADDPLPGIVAARRALTSRIRRRLRPGH